MLRRLERLAVALDSAIVIPGTRIRFGADAVLGLFPGGGDVVGAVLSGYIIVEAARLGLPAKESRAHDRQCRHRYGAGRRPVAGDLFDVYWKANLRNIEILRRHMPARLAPPPR